VKKSKIIISILILILVDQAIKIIISNFFFEPHTHVIIIDGVLNFCPMQNIYLGWIPSILDYMMPVYMAVLLDIIAMLILFAAYRYLKFCAFRWDKYGNLPDIFLTLMLSAACCALVDDIFWGGSIDYIRLFDWFTFDLKDSYSSIAITIMFFYLIIFFIQYYKLTKEERKKYDKKVKFFNWLKLGLPIKYDTENK